MSLHARRYTLKSGKISTTWHYDFEHKKHRYRGSFGHCSKTKATAQYESLKSSVKEGRYQEKREPEPTFATFLQDFLADYQHRSKPRSYARHTYSAKALLPVFGDDQLSSITDRHVDAYIHGRLRQRKSPVTINREVGLLKHVLSTAAEWQLIPESPLRRVRHLRELSRDRVLTSEEEESLLFQAREPLRWAVIVALDTGFRESELVSLTRQSVNVRDRMLTVANAYAKTGETRTVEMTDRVWRLIERRLAVQTDRSAPLLGIQHATSIKRAFRKARDRAGLPDVHFHDLRATFATNLLLSGVELWKVQYLLGHKTVTQTMRYARMTGGDTRGTLAGLPKVGFRRELPHKSPAPGSWEVAGTSECQQ